MLRFLHYLICTNKPEDRDVSFLWWNQGNPQNVSGEKHNWLLTNELINYSLQITAIEN